MEICDAFVLIGNTRGASGCLHPSEWRYHLGRVSARDEARCTTLLYHFGT